MLSADKASRDLDSSVTTQISIENKHASIKQDVVDGTIDAPEMFKLLAANITRFKLTEHVRENKEHKIEGMVTESDPNVVNYLAEEIPAFQMIIDSAIKYYKITGATTYLGYPMESHIGKHVFAFINNINKDKLAQYKDAFKFLDTTEVMLLNQSDVIAVKKKVTNSVEVNDFKPIKLTELKAKENDVLFIVISDQNPLFNAKSLSAVVTSARQNACLLNINVIPTGTLQRHSIILTNKLTKKEKRTDINKQARRKEIQNENRARMACYEAGYQCVITESAHESKQDSYKAIRHYSAKDLIDNIHARLKNGGWDTEKKGTVELQTDSKGIVSIPDLPKGALDDLEIKNNIQLIKKLNQATLEENHIIATLNIASMFDRKERNQAFIVPWREIVALPEYKQYQEETLKKLKPQCKITDYENKLNGIDDRLDRLKALRAKYYNCLIREFQDDDQDDFASTVKVDNKGNIIFETNLPLHSVNKPIKLLFIDLVKECNRQITNLSSKREHYAKLKYNNRKIYIPKRRMTSTKIAVKPVDFFSADHKTMHDADRQSTKSTVTHSGDLLISRVVKQPEETNSSDIFSRKISLLTDKETNQFMLAGNDQAIQSVSLNNPEYTVKIFGDLPTGKSTKNPKETTVLVDPLRQEACITISGDTFSKRFTTDTSGAPSNITASSMFKRQNKKPLLKFLKGPSSAKTR